MFSISPSIVISRTLSSFVPSLHGPLLKQPDMYGPLVAVFSLPQVRILLISIFSLAILYLFLIIVIIIFFSPLNF